MMKKKTYNSPVIDFVNAEAMGFLCNSRVWNDEIPYGGIDDEGTQVPGSRWQDDVWCDEADEEDFL